MEKIRQKLIYCLQRIADDIRDDETPVEEYVKMLEQILKEDKEHSYV